MGKLIALKLLDQIIDEGLALDSKWEKEYTDYSPQFWKEKRKEKFKKLYNRDPKPDEIQRIIFDPQEENYLSMELESLFDMEIEQECQEWAFKKINKLREHVKDLRIEYLNKHNITVPCNNYMEFVVFLEDVRAFVNSDSKVFLNAGGGNKLITRSTGDKSFWCNTFLRKEGKKLFLYVRNNSSQSYVKILISDREKNFLTYFIDRLGVEVAIPKLAEILDIKSELTGQDKMNSFNSIVNRTFKSLEDKYKANECNFPIKKTLNGKKTVFVRVE